MNSKRSANIELLRIISMILIVLHHICAHGEIEFAFPSMNAIIRQMFYTSGGGTGNNLFILIAGYFSASSSKLSLNKICKLVLLVVFYSVFLYILSCAFGATDFSIKGLLISTIPFISNGYWFVNCYLLVYICSPLLVQSINRVSKQNIQLIICVLFVVFYFFQQILSQFIHINDFGYTKLAWMFFVYIVGAYIRIYNVKIQNRLYVFLWLCAAVLVLFTVSILSVYGVDDGSTVGIVLRRTVTLLTNKGVNGTMNILLSIILFLIFCDCTVDSKCIVSIASITFPVYLFHDNVVFRQYLWTNIFHTSEWWDKSLFVVYLFATTIVIFIVTYLIEFIRTRLIDKLIYQSKIYNSLITRLEDWLEGRNCNKVTGT